MGYEVRTNVRITQISGKEEDEKYGDIDVLAYVPDGSRVLVVECKDLHFAKMLGEVAEELHRFRGVEVDGKPDDLLRHLRRVRWCASNTDQLAAYLGLSCLPRVEPYLVFSFTSPLGYSPLGATDTKVIDFTEVEASVGPAIADPDGRTSG